jgi:hypothetical protein
MISNRRIAEYKGNQYVLGSRLEMKCPKTGEWLDAIIYVSIKTGRAYVRAWEDFQEKFKISIRREW